MQIEFIQPAAADIDAVPIDQRGRLLPRFVTVAPTFKPDDELVSMPPAEKRSYVFPAGVRADLPPDMATGFIDGGFAQLVAEPVEIVWKTQAEIEEEYPLEDRAR